MKLWLLPLLLSLAACTEYTGDKAFNQYQQQLARMLALPVPDTSLPAVLPLPPEHSLKQPLPDLRLALTDALATRQCSLDTLIGERNSSTGKIYGASQQLSYELRFLYQLEYCLTQHWNNTALLAQLQQVYQQKLHSINIAFANMLLTDNTLRKELLGIRKALPVSAAAGFDETTAALTELRLLQQFITEQNWRAASMVNIEQQLQVLHHYNFAARLQYSLRLSAHKLAQFNLMTAQTSPANLCTTGQGSEQQRTLTKLFSGSFINEIQHYHITLGAYQQQIWPLLQQLYAATPLSSQLEQRFEHSYLVMQNEFNMHRQWWQAINNQCRLRLAVDN